MAKPCGKPQLVLLCVKPQTVEEVVRQIADDLTPEPPCDFRGGKRHDPLHGRTDSRKPVPVIRIMPNTPCLIKKGMTAIAAGKHATADHVAQAQKIFDAIGRSLILDEKHMDAVTGLSASGPAFVYIIIESFVEAGVKVGLPREAATQLAAQMVLGAVEHGSGNRRASGEAARTSSRLRPAARSTEFSNSKTAVCASP